jgi:hypothetical protein
MAPVLPVLPVPDGAAGSMPVAVAEAVPLCTVAKIPGDMDTVGEGSVGDDATVERVVGAAVVREVEGDVEGDVEGEVIEAIAEVSVLVAALVAALVPVLLAAPVDPPLDAAPDPPPIPFTGAHVPV